MDKISGVSEDELLVKILSFLPTEVAVTTSVLSKRWKYLWKRVLKLEYDDIGSKKKKSSNSRKGFRRFVKRNLQTNRDSALESLCLNFSSTPYTPEDIKSWVGFAVSRGVRELSIAYSSSSQWSPARLPETLYFCKSLVSLKLEKDISVSFPRWNCIPTRLCLPALKTLHLRSVISYYFSEPLQDFLRICPVLEKLILEHSEGGRLIKFNVIVPSLQRLSLKITDATNYKGYTIDTPSLKYFKVKDTYNCHSCSIAKMPKLEDAYIDVIFPDFNKFLKPITSVKRLSLCLRVNNAEDVYTDEIVFNQLEHLKLCTCSKYWSKLLFQLLKDSPKLRVLELHLINKHKPCSVAPTVCWKNQLSCDPQCFETSLETFKWIGCEGRQEERDVVTYILNNARCLKTATVLNESRIDMINSLQPQVTSRLL